MPTRWFRSVGVWAAVALVVSISPAVSEDKEKPALSGSWAQKDGELRMEFAEKDVLKISPHGKDELVLIICKYTRGKDGRVKVKVTELAGSAREQVQNTVPIGLEFSFVWKVHDDRATLEGVEGEKAEVFKSRLQGDFEKK